MIQICRLSEWPLEKILAAWNEGFSDYFVKMEMAPERFRRFLHANGIDLTLSVGAEAGGKPIGLVLNAVQDVDGIRTAWNGGTAIAPAFRGQGIGSKMMERYLEICRDQKVHTVTLEVIAANMKAKNLYERTGYRLTDRLLTYIWKQERTIPFAVIPATYHVVETSPREAAALPFYNQNVPWRSMWCNIPDGKAVLVIDDGENIVGYALYQDAENPQGTPMRILRQCEVLPSCEEGETIARAALSRVFGPDIGETLRQVSDLTASNQTVTRVLEQEGFSLLLEQFLMTRTLDPDQEA
jgi:ribosomal protein S18 acetylase RimI-like enzyme